MSFRALHKQQHLEAAGVCGSNMAVFVLALCFSLRDLLLALLEIGVRAT